MGKLDGRVALITGSGRNIGRATALMMAGEGANIVVNARSNRDEAEATAAAVEELGVKALPVLADVSQKEQVDAMIDAAMSTFGHIDILVNNAAIRPHKPFTEVTVEDWEYVRGVVLDGSFYTTRGVIQQMVDNNFGRIVFLTGDGAFPGQPAARPRFGGQDGHSGHGPQPGFGVRAPQHPGQRGLSRQHRHHAGQPRMVRRPRSRLVGHSVGPPGQAGRDCGDGDVPLHR